MDAPIFGQVRVLGDFIDHGNNFEAMTNLTLEIKSLLPSGPLVLASDLSFFLGPRLPSKPLLPSLLLLLGRIIAGSEYLEITRRVLQKLFKSTAKARA